MNLSPLTAISPIDGRYRSKTEQLDIYFSEFALIRYRVKVEVEYFIALCQLPLPQLSTVSHDKFQYLRDIYKNFSVEDAQHIKDIESITNHDVKAVEYFLKEKFDQTDLQQYKEFIHFGLTSQDINNTSIPMSVKDALNDVYMPLINDMLSILDRYAAEWNNVPMLARTHGQPASPTRLGKEIRVFTYRLREQLQLLSQVPISGKFGGATGNFNAHLAAFPQYDWIAFANSFLQDTLGIKREQWTTQISNYDNFGALFDTLKRINTIIIDLDRDIWQYISMNYFKQKIKAGEVGLQRDLTDSTVLRNIGVPFGHTIIALHSTIKGLNKLILNEDAINADLDGMWNVVAEAIQTILRREGYEKPYETLKALTRTNSVVNAESIANFIDTLNVTDAVKAELKKLSPHNYTGY